MWLRYLSGFRGGNPLDWMGNDREGEEMDSKREGREGELVRKGKEKYVLGAQIPLS